MASKEYLKLEERTAAADRFEILQQLLAEQKGLFLQLPEWANNYLKTQTPTNQVEFLLDFQVFDLNEIFKDGAEI